MVYGGSGTSGVPGPGVVCQLKIYFPTVVSSDKCKPYREKEVNYEDRERAVNCGWFIFLEWENKYSVNDLGNLSGLHNTQYFNFF